MDLNHWDVAMNLAMKHDELQYVESAIAKYTMFLIDSGNPLQAVQVHIDGGQQLEAAKILVRLACQMATIKVTSTHFRHDHPLKCWNIVILFFSHRQMQLSH